ncbi:hypothetical protein MBLNU459_g1223t1 [Dothideomycetes sp. NU459]
MSAEHHDDELVPEQTEGFKVGEKKTIDEYQQLAEPCSLPKSGPKISFAPDPDRTGSQDDDARPTTSPMLIDSSGLTSLDREYFYAPGELPDSAKPQYTTAEHWAGEEPVIFQDPFSGRRPGTAEVNGTRRDETAAAEPPTNIPLLLPAVFGLGSDAQSQDIDARDRQDTLAGSMSARAAGKRKATVPVVPEVSDGATAAGYATAELDNKNDPMSPKDNGARYDDRTWTHKFSTLVPSLNTKVDLAEDDELSPMSSDPPRSQFAASLPSAPSIDAGLDGTQERLPQTPAFSPCGYREVKDRDCQAALQRLKALGCEEDSSTRVISISGRTEHEQSILIVRWA